jgi:hypothetical protein
MLVAEQHEKCNAMRGERVRKWRKPIYTTAGGESRLPEVYPLTWRRASLAGRDTTRDVAQWSDHRSVVGWPKTGRM